MSSNSEKLEEIESMLQCIKITVEVFTNPNLGSNVFNWIQHPLTQALAALSKRVEQMSKELKEENSYVR